jgi:hypothetical protein
MAIPLVAVPLTLAAIALATLASATPPTLIGPTLLPGNDGLDPSAANEEAPFLCRGQDGFLAVWADGRTNFFSPPPFVEEQTARDIYAARLDAAGNPIDSIPIVVDQAFGYQIDPIASWNGESWLVVWECQAPTPSYYAAAIKAARIAPDGTLLDATPITVLAYPWSGSAMFSVASNGSEWVIVAQGTSSGENDLVAVRLAANGSVLDTPPLVLVPAAYYLYFDIRIQYADGEYLLTYDNLSDLRARRFTTSLFPISTYTLPGLLLESNGSGYYLTWASGGNYVGSPMTKEGVRTFPAGVLLGSANGVYETDLAWDGVRWWFSVYHASQGVLVRRVAADGTVFDTAGIPLDPAAAQFVSDHVIEGAPGGGVLAAWEDRSPGGATPYDIRAVYASSEGVPAPRGKLAFAAPAQLAADVTEGPTGFLAVFRSELSGTQSVYAQRLDFSGDAIDPEPILLGSGQFIGRPAAVWNGTVYLVVWSDGTTILGKRIQQDGVVLDGAPIAIMPGITPDVAAVGSMFVVVGTDIIYNNSELRVPFARRVDGVTGAVLGTPLQLGWAFAQYPRVIALDDRWVAMWQRNFSHDDPQAELSGAFLETDGTASPEFGETTFISGFTPDLAYSGSVVLIVYRSRTEGSGFQAIEALRMLPDGTFNGGFTIANPPDQQFNPRVTWNASEFLAVWDDKRNATTFFDERTDVYAARFTADGAVLDPGGFPVANDVLPAQLPAVATVEDQRSIVLASLFRSGAPHSSYRVGSYLVIANPVDVPLAEETRPDGHVQAWPNPFAGEISFRVSVPRSTRVRLEIFDVQGRRVRTVFDGSLGSGSHEMSWKAAGASAGTYYYRLATDEVTKSGRLTLVR